LWSNRGSTDKAESFHLKAIAVGEELVRLFPHPSERMELSQSYVTLGGMYQARNQRKKAQEMYRKGVAIQESLARELPSIVAYRSRLAESYGNLSLVLDNADESIALLQRGRDLLEPLMREHPEDTVYAADFGNLCNNQAVIFFHGGEPRKVLPWHDRAVEVLTAAHRRNPSDGECTYRFSMALGARAFTWNVLQEHRKALADWDQLIEIVDPAQGDQHRFLLIVTLTQLGEHRRAAEEVRTLLDRAGTSQQMRFHCVCVLSHLLESAEGDRDLTKEERAKASDSYAACALEALSHLRHDGYFRNPKKWLELATEKDLSTLRERAKFKRWCLKQLTW
jgi:tetratricopeptide (TPR) repeat protein